MSIRVNGICRHFLSLLVAQEVEWPEPYEKGTKSHWMNTNPFLGPRIIPYKWAIYIPGAYPEIFRGRGFEIFLYRRENLEVFWDFFLFFLKKILTNWKKLGGGGWPQKLLREYAPGLYSCKNHWKITIF